MGWAAAAAQSLALTVTELACLYSTGKHNIPAG